MTVQAPCSDCGGKDRKHEVIAEHEVGSSGDADYQWQTVYQICRCGGCGVVRFREASFSEDDPEGQVRVFPENHGARYRPIDVTKFPETIARIYRETVRALNAGAPTLTGGGLRAIVEALCKEQRVVGGNLMEKIDALVSAGLLAKPQAALLHEERYLGNSSLHELIAPEPDELAAGLEIVETLLSTIYILPAKAKDLQERRKNAKSGR